MMNNNETSISWNFHIQFGGIERLTTWREWNPSQPLYSWMDRRAGETDYEPACKHASL